ncbi:hypothetical protein FOA52_013154 [Chlamydomonas sp. UWO 241]|nr:hypothetical protein FOA52_013154 [Chlamydomonas sp. UWO 241]
MVIAHMQEELKDGRDIFDLGETLYSFFVRYGEEFDYERDASLFDVSRALQRVFKASSSPYFEVIGGRERLEITAEYGQGDGADDDDDVGSSIRGNGGAVGATGDDDDHGDELARVPTSSARGKGGGRGGRGGSGQPRRA